MCQWAAAPRRTRGPVRLPALRVSRALCRRAAGAIASLGGHAHPGAACAVSTRRRSLGHRRQGVTVHAPSTTCSTRAVPHGRASPPVRHRAGRLTCRTAIRLGMSRFVAGMAAAVPAFVAERRRRAGPLQPDPRVRQGVANSVSEYKDAVHCLASRGPTGCQAAPSAAARARGFARLAVFEQSAPLRLLARRRTAISATPTSVPLAVRRAGRCARAPLRRWAWRASLTRARATARAKLRMVSPMSRVWRQLARWRRPGWRGCTARSRARLRLVWAVRAARRRLRCCLRRRGRCGGRPCLRLRIVRRGATQPTAAEARRQPAGRPLAALPAPPARHWPRRRRAWPATHCLQRRMRRLWPVAKRDGRARSAGRRRLGRRSGSSGRRRLGRRSGSSAGRGCEGASGRRGALRAGFGLRCARGEGRGEGGQRAGALTAAPCLCAACVGPLQTEARGEEAADADEAGRRPSPFAERAAGAAGRPPPPPPMQLPCTGGRHGSGNGVGGGGAAEPLAGPVQGGTRGPLPQHAARVLTLGLLCATAWDWLRGLVPGPVPERGRRRLHGGCEGAARGAREGYEGYELRVRVTRVPSVTGGARGAREGLAAQGGAKGLRGPLAWSLERPALGGVVLRVARGAGEPAQRVAWGVSSGATQ